ncbi:protein-export membrane protein SecF [Hahella sp. CCB-MM4]|uniref:protein translocase subunit SecF n=1 Tax=Hahella sp. (strain CCB-MM4) TaxID=1926491 RepID=UPI000B9C54CE|nr:protein translocase subunit SecF [Hahella sp. CCB-MM4]OZG73846.1 protein-export membrane protein SecF [Hahella sp. CCB-MM4]
MADEKIYNFMGISKAALGLSLALIIISIVAIAYRGLSLGLDFTGGTLVEVQYEQAPSVPQIKQLLEQGGYQNFVVQKFGADTSILVRLQQGYSDEIGQEVLTTLRGGGQAVDLVRSEFVGAQVGEELREQGGLGLLLALGMIMIYISFRFQFKFAVGAVGALIHDVIITVGCFSVLQWDFDLNVLAAVLAVIGYSLNDTIVVSDRIRENFRRVRKESPTEIINISLTQTLSRTIVTGLTTLLVLVALYMFGGEALEGFSKALIIGIVVGTYSSIYVASSSLLMMGISKEDLMIPVKEGVEADDMP